MCIMSCIDSKIYSTITECDNLDPFFSGSSSRLIRNTEKTNTTHISAFTIHAAIIIDTFFKTLFMWRNNLEQKYHFLCVNCSIVMFFCEKKLTGEKWNINGSEKWKYSHHVLCTCHQNSYKESNWKMNLTSNVWKQCSWAVYFKSNDRTLIEACQNLNI